jgi:hypothetical protein
LRVESPEGVLYGLAVTDGRVGMRMLAKTQTPELAKRSFLVDENNFLTQGKFGGTVPH